MCTVTLFTEAPETRWSVEHSFNWPLRMFFFYFPCYILFRGTKQKVRDGREGKKKYHEHFCLLFYRWLKRMLISKGRAKTKKSSARWYDNQLNFSVEEVSLNYDFSMSFFLSFVFFFFFCLLNTQHSPELTSSSINERTILLHEINPSLLSNHILSLPFPSHPFFYFFLPFSHSTRFALGALPLVCSCASSAYIYLLGNYSFYPSRFSLSR